LLERFAFEQTPRLTRFRFPIKNSNRGCQNRFPIKIGMTLSSPNGLLWQGENCDVPMGGIFPNRFPLSAGVAAMSVKLSRNKENWH
jgi:hypothetical protein